ncbi:unnamed protein product [Mytilus coruscus]|uniref:Uncharacterized protein n=1 Tax=Mytilus coruscus TaxID=42192 RepID=A0A6J8BRV8_MYTCO|nr:unnamed protein product [Mytilus coruscus]
MHLDILNYIQNCPNNIKLMPKIEDPLDSCEDYNDETRNLTEEQRSSLTKYLCDNFQQITFQHPDGPSIIHCTITFILTHRPSDFESGQVFDLTPFLESYDNIDNDDTDSGKIENDKFSNGLHAVAFMDNFIDEYGDPSPDRDVMLLPDCIDIKYMYDEYRTIPGLGKNEITLFCDRPYHVTLKYRKCSTDSWLPEADQNQIELFDLDITGDNTIPQGIPKICQQHYDDSRIEMVRNAIMKMKNFLNIQEYTWWMEFLNNQTKATPTKKKKKKKQMAIDEFTENSQDYRYTNTAGANRRS